MKPRRTHAPGAAIHITARTQNKAIWFVEELRDEIASIVREGVQSFGHHMLAYIVMPNHFHILLQQSHSPLAHAMQRIMQRTSFLVRKKHDIDGHAFSRSYWSDVCGHPDYVRNAIVYTNLNAWKVGLCASPDDYRWSSHGSYTGAVTSEFEITRGLLLFATKSSDIGAARKQYLAAIREAMLRWQGRVPGNYLIPGWHRLRWAKCPEGDNNWATYFSQEPFERDNSLRMFHVRQQTEALLRRAHPNCDVDMLRNAGRSRSIAPIRQAIVAALASRGNRHCDIARCLRVSPALVSRIAACIRDSAARKQ